MFSMQGMNQTKRLWSTICCSILFVRSRSCDFYESYLYATSSQVSTNTQFRVHSKKRIMYHYYQYAGITVK